MRFLAFYAPKITVSSQNRRFSAVTPLPQRPADKGKAQGKAANKLNARFIEQAATAAARREMRSLSKYGFCVRKINAESVFSMIRNGMPGAPEFRYTGPIG